MDNLGLILRCLCGEKFTHWFPETWMGVLDVSERKCPRCRDKDAPKSSLAPKYTCSVFVHHEHTTQLEAMMCGTIQALVRLQAGERHGFGVVDLRSLNSMLVQDPLVWDSETRR